MAALDKRKFFLQALLLTAVSLLLRTVGVSAQVYISARIGAEAVGVSSLIGSVGGFAVTLALSGIGLGCTRLVSEGLGRRDAVFVHRTLRCSVVHALGFGTLAALLLFFGADTIARLWLRDLRTVTSLRLMALTLPFISLSSCLAGYFVAVRRVWKSACVQVGEEIVRVLATILLLSHLIANGLEAALLALALANAIADISSSLVMLLLFLLDRKAHLPPQDQLEPSIGVSTVAKRLLSVTMPIATAAYARSGLITLEHMLIPVGLQRFGQSHGAALADYGALHSMALPVVLFPCALLTSFASLLVPELTEAHVRGENDRIRAVMRRVFSLTLIFSIGVAGILLFYSRELGLLLYGSEQAALYIRVLAPLIPVMYMDSATDAMLKGLGQQVYSMKVNIADASLSVLLVWLLLPLFGIWGYVITIYFTELLNAALSIARLWQISGMKPSPRQWVAKPLLSIVGATALSRFLIALSPLLRGHGTTAATLVAHILLSVILYCLFLFLLGALGKRDLAWMKGFIFSRTTP